MNPLDAARGIVQAAEEQREFQDDPIEALRSELRREYGHIAGVEAYLKSPRFFDLVVRKMRAELRRRGIES